MLTRIYSPSFQILVCRLQKLVQVCHRYNALDVMFSLTFKGYVPDITPREHTLCSATPLIHPVLPKVPMVGDVISPILRVGERVDGDLHDHSLSGLFLYPST